MRLLILIPRGPFEIILLPRRKLNAGGVYKVEMLTKLGYIALNTSVLVVLLKLDSIELGRQRDSILLEKNRYCHVKSGLSNFLAW